MEVKELSPEAIEARRKYWRDYYRQNKDHINARAKDWRKNNQDKVKQYDLNRWESRAKRMEGQSDED